MKFSKVVLATYFVLAALSVNAQNSPDLDTTMLQAMKKYCADSKSKMGRDTQHCKTFYMAIFEEDSDQRNAASVREDLRMNNIDIINKVNALTTNSNYKW